MQESLPYERFQRQMRLPGFGQEGQDKLSAARVLVVGAGGLGCPVLQYLAAAGIGTIGIADPDVVSLSNLHRQVLYGMEEIGMLKVEAAAKSLKRIDPAITIHIYPEHWSQQSCDTHFDQYDIIVDASDNFPTKYLLNDACMIWRKPLVFGAVSRFQGQVAVFDGRSADPVHYRDFHPIAPASDAVMNCAEAGVIGMLTGIIGNMQALEVVKLITGLGRPLTGTILTYDGLRQDIYTISGRKDVHPLPDMPRNRAEFLEWDYQQSQDCQTIPVQEITPEELQILPMRNHILLIDVRELHEQPRMHIAHLSIPLSSLPEQIGNWKDRPLIFICQSGQRSMQAARMVLAENQAGQVYSLRGGIEALASIQSEQWI